MDGSMSGSVNGMVRSEDGQKFFTGGDDKVKIKARIPCSKNVAESSRFYFSW